MLTDIKVWRTGDNSEDFDMFKNYVNVSGLVNMYFATCTEDILHFEASSNVTRDELSELLSFLDLHERLTFSSMVPRSAYEVLK